jgi:hypothetical protein
MKKFLLGISCPILVATAAAVAVEFAQAKRVPCPATQPGLILRDPEHPPTAPTDREYVVIIDGDGTLKLLNPGLNRSEAEALAVQLGKAFPGLTFTARPQISLEPAK